MQSAVEKRNADYQAIVQKLAFKKGPANASAYNTVNLPAASTSTGYDTLTDDPVRTDAQALELLDEGMGLKSCDLLIWMGDFNYRINLDR